MARPCTRARANTFIAPIQGLRGLSALSVYFFHVYDMSRKQGFFPHSIAWASPIFKSGAHGVEIFFMISGFLITGSLINHADARRFLIDRCIRIYPVFLVIQAILFAAESLAGFKEFSGITVSGWFTLWIENSLFLPGIFDLPLVQLNAWSLSYEALFYLIAAATWVIAVRWGKMSARAFAGPVCVFMLWQYPVCIFFLIGIAVFLWGAVPRLRVPSLASVPLLVVTLYLLALSVEHPYLKFVAALPGLLAFCSVVRGTGALARLASTRTLMYFGSISYSFYLWHPVVTFPLKVIFAREADRLGQGLAMSLFGAFGFIGTIVIAHFSHEYLEVRASRLLKRPFMPVSLLSGYKSNKIGYLPES
jgi:peptidoglycan/LPS O-acetylase OafA/YrhL